MKNLTLSTADIRPVDKFILSFPIRKEFYENLHKKFFPLPFILVNRLYELIFSIDYFYYLKSSNVLEIKAMQLDIPDMEALFINYNLKEVFTGINLYEKLMFIKKILPSAKMSDIYKNINLNISLNDDLVKKLDLLISDEFSQTLSKERISLKSALTLCEFLPENRKYLMNLFLKLSFSHSHQQKILELIEEIQFREKCSVSEIFEKLGISQFVDLEMPQKQIINELYKFRHPLFQKHQSEWKKEIKQLNMPANMKLTHYPFFEKKRLQLAVGLDSLDELKKIYKKILN